MEYSQKKKNNVVLHTTFGNIKINLFSEFAPNAANNFMELAVGARWWMDPIKNSRTQRSLYQGTIFHRVIADFMIQGGDPTGTGKGGPGYRFSDEFHPALQFDRPYLLAMANNGPGTNGSQFFITVKEAPWLNYRHTIFGEVKEEKSQQVVIDISKVKTGVADRPLENIRINSVSLL